MFESAQRDKLAFRLEAGAEALDTSQKELSALVRKHGLRTFRIGKHEHIPNFEMDRLVSLLLQEQVAGDIEKAEIEKHGTGVQAHG